MAMRKVAAIDGQGNILVLEEPLAAPKPGQVQIEVAASMVSPGTELGGVKRRRENPSDAAPRPFGYSNAGVVVAQGEGCEDIPLGTRVACMGGGYAQHATHACVPRNMAVPIPDGVSDGDAASIHLVATALNAVRRGAFQIGEHIAVAGLGLVGQFACQWARIAGSHVMGLDQLPMRLEKAAACGLHRGVDIAEEDPVAVSRTFSRGYGIDGGVIAFGGDGTPAFVTLAKMIKKAPDTHLMGRIDCGRCPNRPRVCRRAGQFGRAKCRRAQGRAITTRHGNTARTIRRFLCSGQRAEIWKSACALWTQGTSRSPPSSRTALPLTTRPKRARN